MARGVNKVILVGNLGQDPETRITTNGSAVTNITIATSEKWKDKQTGQDQERTEWHRVIFFNKLAEIAGEYLVKGSQVYVEGQLRTRKWQDQNGQDRYTTEIVANEMQMLGSRGDSNSAQPVRQQQSLQQPQQQPPPVANMNPNGTQRSPYEQQPQQMPPADVFDDDIPF